MKICTLGCRSFSCWLGLSWARAAAGDAALFAPLSALFSRRGGQRAGCSAAAATAATGALGAVFPTFPTGWEEAPAVAGRSSFELGRSWSSWTLMLRWVKGVNLLSNVFAIDEWSQDITALAWSEYRSEWIWFYILIIMCHLFCMFCYPW